MRFLFKTICVAGMALGVSTTVHASTKDVLHATMMAAQNIYVATISPECKASEDDLKAYVVKGGLGDEYVKTYKRSLINSGISLEEYKKHQNVFDFSIYLIGSNKCLYEPIRRANNEAATPEEINEIIDEMIKAMKAIGEVF